MLGITVVSAKQLSQPMVVSFIQLNDNVAGCGGGMVIQIPKVPLLLFPFDQTLIHAVVPGVRPVV